MVAADRRPNRRSAQRIGPELKRRGLVFVGIDVIGDKHHRDQRHLADGLARDQAARRPRPRGARSGTPSRPAARRSHERSSLPRGTPRLRAALAAMTRRRRRASCAPRLPQACREAGADHAAFRKAGGAEARRVHRRAARRGAGAAGERRARHGLRAGAQPRRGPRHPRAARGAGRQARSRRRQAAGRMRSSRSAATGAARWRRNPTSTCCSSPPTRATPRIKFDRRDAALCPVGPEAEGRPRDALGRRLHRAGARGHDDPHLAAGGAAAQRRRQAVRDAAAPVRHRRSSPRRRSEFVAAKLAERDKRIQRQGESRYLVEPNVKEGKGGLRDLNTLFWIAKYVYRVAGHRRTGRRRAVHRRGIASLFRRCEEFLWAVRCHLHFLTGRAEERLTFDLQPPIAKTARLRLARRPDRRRALHEALFPGRQGRRRSHRHRLRGAGGAADQARRRRSTASSPSCAAGRRRSPRRRISASTSSASTSSPTTCSRRTRST